MFRPCPQRDTSVSRSHNCFPVPQMGWLWFWFLSCYQSSQKKPSGMAGWEKLRAFSAVSKLFRAGLESSLPWHMWGGRGRKRLDDNGYVHDSVWR